MYPATDSIYLWLVAQQLNPARPGANLRVGNGSFDLAIGLAQDKFLVFSVGFGGVEGFVIFDLGFEIWDFRF